MMDDVEVESRGLVKRIIELPTDDLVWFGDFDRFTSAGGVRVVIGTSAGHAYVVTRTSDANAPDLVELRDDKEIYPSSPEYTLNRAHANTVFSAVFSPIDRNTIVTASDGSGEVPGSGDKEISFDFGSAKCWRDDGSGWKRVARFHDDKGDPIWSARFHPASAPGHPEIVTASADGSCRRHTLGPTVASEVLFQAEVVNEEAIGMRLADYVKIDGAYVVCVVLTDGRVLLLTDARNPEVIHDSTQPSIDVAAYESGQVLRAVLSGDREQLAIVYNSTSRSASERGVTSGKAKQADRKKVPGQNAPFLSAALTHKGDVVVTGSVESRDEQSAGSEVLLWRVKQSGISPIKTVNAFGNQVVIKHPKWAIKQLVAGPYDSGHFDLLVVGEWVDGERKGNAWLYRLLETGSDGVYRVLGPKAVFESDFPWYVTNAAFHPSDNENLVLVTCAEIEETAQLQYRTGRLCVFEYSFP